MDKAVTICGIVAGAAILAAAAGTSGTIIGAGIAQWFTSHTNDIYIVSQIFGTIGGVAGLLVGALFGKIYSSDAASKMRS